MQSFVRHIMGSEERILLLARLHWIYLVTGFIWMTGLMIFGATLDYWLWYYFGSYVPMSETRFFGLRIAADTPVMLFMFGGCGVTIFILHTIKTLASEIALTNQRIIYKTGLIFVEVEEIDLVEIRAEHVHHGMLGRFLGYGQLQLDSRFVGDIHLPAVKKPYKLIKAMHSARQKIHDPMDGPVSPHHPAASK